MYHFIQHQSDLDSLLIHINPNNTYALDTEFIKVDTLWPKLGVFQINISGVTYLLDGTTLDFSVFWQKIKQTKQLVFHACGEDIDLIYYYGKFNQLDHVFDTQIALAFLGYGLQVSYQNALKQILDINIEKDQTRSDWLARPLTQEQLSYAANDVIYLPQLAEKLQKSLQEKNMLAYVQEDCQSFTREIGKKTPTHRLYQDVANYRHSRRQLMQIQQLSVWREELVQRLNTPRSFILKNATIIDLVEKNPRNSFQLAHIKGIRANVIREYGKIILDLLKFLPEKEMWPQSIYRPVKYISPEISEKIEQLIESVVVETGVPRPILMRKKWLNDLYHYVVREEQDLSYLSSYLTGWRYKILTQPLLVILKQESSTLKQQMKNCK